VIFWFQAFAFKFNLYLYDEAYIEFSGTHTSRIADVPKHDNLIVLRTFSKRAALAGEKRFVLRFFFFLKKPFRRRLCCWVVLTSRRKNFSQQNN
jgi:hypothetical protein